MKKTFITSGPGAIERQLYGKSFNSVSAFKDPILRKFYIFSGM